MQILSAAPPTSPLPDRAVFQYTPVRDTAIGQDVCLQSGVLELSTVSVYINGTFTWWVPHVNLCACAPLSMSRCAHHPCQRRWNKYRVQAHAYTLGSNRDSPANSSASLSCAGDQVKRRDQLINGVG